MGSIIPITFLKYYPNYIKEEVKLEPKVSGLGLELGPLLPEVVSPCWYHLWLVSIFCRLGRGDPFLPEDLGLQRLRVNGENGEKGVEGLGEKVLSELPQASWAAPQALLVRFVVTQRQDALRPNMDICRWKRREKGRHINFDVRLLFFLIQTTVPFSIHLAPRQTLRKKIRTAKLGNSGVVKYHER